MYSTSGGIQVCWGLVHEWGKDGDQCSGSSYVVNLLVRCGEEGGEPKSEALVLPADLIKKTKSWRQAAEMSFLRRVPGCSLTERVRSRATAHAQQKRKLRQLGHVFWMSLRCLPGELCSRHVMGGDPGKTQDRLEREGNVQTVYSNMYTYSTSPNNAGLLKLN